MKKLILFQLIIITLWGTNGCNNNSANALSGTWTSLAKNSMVLTLTFDNNNNFITNVKAGDQHFLANGKYAVHEDTLFIRDTLNTPMVLCNYFDTGSYIFKTKGDSVFLNPIADNCEKRKFALEIGLVKVKK